MADQLPKTPILPTNLRSNDPTTQDSLGALNKALFNFGIDVTLRLNLAFMRDGSERMEAPLPIMLYATADLPDATLNEGNLAYDTTLTQLTYSNGTAWQYPVLGSYQPLDGDLTAIAALVTTSFGRSFLTLADALAARTLIDVYSVAQTDTVGTNAAASAVATIRNGVAAAFDTLAEVATELALKATIASPTFTGVPAAPTAAAGTNTTQLATTAFVKAAIDVVLGGVSASFDTLAEIATELALKATIASPTFTGTPAAPTAAVNTNTTQLATTAFVLAQATGTTPIAEGTAAVGSETKFARGDHVHPGSANAHKMAAVIVIDGGGATITTGVKGDVRIPWAATITKVSLLADQSGSIVVDVWKDTYANYPPVVGDSIAASAKPTLSSATKSEDSTLTGWTTAVAAGDTIRFNVDSITTCQRVTLTIEMTKT